MKNENNRCLGVSVVMPVYNGMPLLKESIESVLDQKSADFEILIGEDNSVDESLNYLSSLTDDHISLLKHKENIGLFANLNFLVKKARYELIQIWTQDDIMMEGCLKETIEFHNRFPDIAYAYSKPIIIDNKGEIVRYTALEKDESVSVSMHTKTSLITGSLPGNLSNVSLKKQDLADVGYFNESMKYCGDVDMWCKLSKNRPVGIIQKRLIKLRSHEGQLSRSPGMWIYRLKENDGILKAYFDRTNPSERKLIRIGMKWRVYTQYLALLFKLFRLGEINLAKEYYIELRKQCNVVLTMFRYLILKGARKLKMGKKFVNWLYYARLFR